MPTDTIYGIVGRAFDKHAVEKIYRLRRRDRKKPMIILISSIADLALFNILLNTKNKKRLQKVWPGKVSVILPIAHKAVRMRLRYLHRGTGALAFRLPRPLWLRDMLAYTGPLVAPSANFEGESPARTIKEARKYFKAKVNFYMDGGRLVSRPSMLIKINGSRVSILRK